jgi:dissimilatory sulfite reductase (desulfoviridin) alpha/beta subunit
MNIEELRKSGIVKLKGDNIFSVWIKTSCCNLNSTQLREIANIAQKYGKGFVLFSTRQIPIIPFIHYQNVEKVRNLLKKINLEFDRCGPRVRNINVCYSNRICQDAIMNPISLGEKLDKFFYDPILHKIKIGVSGCNKDCIISRVLTDISFIGTKHNSKKGYDVYFGGRLGVNPFIGVKMAEGLSEEKCVKFVENYFNLLKKQGQKGERAADLLKRLGKNKVKKILNKDLNLISNLMTIKCITEINKSNINNSILRIRATCGEVTSEQIRKIADIADKYGEGFVHFNIRGAPEIPCIRNEFLNEIRKELKEVDLEIIEKGIDNFQTCYGHYCTESNMNTQSLLRRLQELINKNNLNDLNIKISAAGCPNSCGIAHVSDIGFIGVVEPEISIDKCTGCGLCASVCKRNAIKVKKEVVHIMRNKCAHCGKCIEVCAFNALSKKKSGISVLIGGSGGENTRLGEIMAEFLTEKEAIQFTMEFLKILKDKKLYSSAIIAKLKMEKLRTIAKQILKITKGV